MKRKRIVLLMLMMLMVIGGVAGGQQLGNQYASLAPDASIVRYDNAKVIQPSDDLIYWYGWLASSERDPKMGVATYINRRALILSPGYYDLGDNTWNVDTNYVDAVSLGGAVVRRSGDSVVTVYQTAMDTRLIGFKILSSPTGISWAFQVENEVRGTGATVSGSTLTKASSGIGDLGLGYKDDITWSERLYDQAYLWTTAGTLTAGWYEIKSGAGDNLTLISHPGNSSGTVYYVLISQHSRYINMEFNGVRGCTSLGTGSGLWLNNVGGDFCYRTENPTGFDTYRELTGSAIDEGDGQVGLTLVAHGLPPKTHVGVINTVSYDGHYAVEDISNADKLIIDIADGVFVTETFSSDFLQCNVAENRAVIMNCIARDSSYIGDTAKAGSGLYMNDIARDDSFSGCSIWASPLSEEAEFVNCIARDRSYGLGNDVEASFYNCTGRYSCFAGFVSIPYYARMKGYMQGCRAMNDSCGSGDPNCSMSGTLEGCNITGLSEPMIVEPGALIRNSRITVTTTGENCIELTDRWSSDAGDPTFNNNDLLVYQGGTGIPIYAAAATDINAVHNRMNNASVNRSGMGANVTNISNQLDMRLVYNAIAISSVITDTTDETTFDNTSFTIDGASLREGDVVEIDGLVEILADNGTDMLTLKLYAANQVIWTGASRNVLAGEITVIKAFIAVNAAGAGGKLAAFGLEGFAGAGYAQSWRFVEAAEDISGAVLLKLTAQWNNDDAGNQVVCRSFQVKWTNSGGNIVDDDIL